MDLTAHLGELELVLRLLVTKHEVHAIGEVVVLVLKPALDLLAHHPKVVCASVDLLTELLLHLLALLDNVENALAVVDEVADEVLHGQVLGAAAFARPTHGR